MSEPTHRAGHAGRGALFALGFRPFYLLAGAHAALSVPLWAAQYAGWLAGGHALAHAHEMVFGYAFAGGAASAEDASTIFWNPAGMTRLPGRQIALGLNAIYGSARFTDQGTTSPAGSAFPITGGTGGNPVGLNWVPNLYFAADVGPNVKAGIGINAPFGLKTKYPADWMGRYQAIDSVVESVNINPAVAWKVGDNVSIGGGVNFQYFEATVSNAIDFGAACFGSPFGPAACSAAGITPQTKDGIAKVSGDSWGVGWNVGAVFELAPDVRVGVAYRSSIATARMGEPVPPTNFRGRPTYRNRFPTTRSRLARPLSSPTNTGSAGMNPTGRRAAGSAHGTPRIHASPRVGRSSPTSSRNTVVLPAPLGPRNPVTDPRPTTRSRSSIPTVCP